MVKKVILLDGGMGQEIVNRGGKGGYGEWATAALHEDPDLVRQIHADYIGAGADVITTNTYGTTRARLRHVGIEDRLGELLRAAGQLACQARDHSAKRDARIAASLPPLEASYASEFTLSFAQMAEEFAELMDLLEPYVDIFLGETLSTTFEAEAFLGAAAGRGKPVWLSLTLEDHGSTHLRGGAQLSDAIASIRISKLSPDALLINCCTPDSITSAMPVLRASGMPFGAYANGFVEIPESWDEAGGVAQLSTRRDLSPEVYSADVARWMEAGAAIVGGCCEVGPAHIARLRQLIDETN
ncbi:MAG: homocysteine S-methyltransferase family protein [Chloroflexota bacterium]|nr:homocysteine S-methyltransferase family protein [Chloroflexota bacterium]